MEVDFPKLFVYYSSMRIFLTSEKQTQIEGVCVNDICISKEEMLQVIKSNEGLVYRKFIDIALKSDVTMKFSKQVQNHIERLGRISPMPDHNIPVAFTVIQSTQSNETNL